MEDALRDHDSSINDYTPVKRHAAWSSRGQNVVYIKSALADDGTAHNNCFYVKYACRNGEAPLCNERSHVRISPPPPVIVFITTAQSCPWVGSTHGLGWVGLGWVEFCRYFSVFGRLGWDHYSKSAKNLNELCRSV